MDHWAVPAVSCLAGSSICSLAGEPWGEVWAVPAGFVLCHCSFCRSCVCESSKPARACFYGSPGQQEEIKPLGVPLSPSFLTGLLGTC